jgi:hypothetical protein
MWLAAQHTPKRTSARRRCRERRNRNRLRRHRHQGPEQPINSGLPQGSPVSPILFIIYVQGVFQAIEDRVPGVKALSFANNIGLLTQASLVDKACQKLQLVGEVAIEWGTTNRV